MLVPTLWLSHSGTRNSGWVIRETHWGEGGGWGNLRCENSPVNRPASRETGLEMPCCPASDLLWVQITQSYPKRLRFSSLLCRARWTPKMGDGGVFRTTCADFSRPVEELEYTCLLKSTFTEASHVRDFKTWQTPATYPECVFCGKMYRWGTTYVECHMDPNISEGTTGNERVVTACAESQSTSRGHNTSNKRNLMVVGGHTLDL